MTNLLKNLFYGNWNTAFFFAGIFGILFSLFIPLELFYVFLIVFCLFFNAQNNLVSLFQTFKLKLILFILWNHLLLIFFFEKFVIFLFSSLCAYYGAFLSNFKHLESVPTLFGLPVSSYLDYLGLQIIFFLFLLGFFVFLLMFFIVFFEPQTFQVKSRFFLLLIFIFSIFSTIFTVSAGSGDEIIIAAD